MKLIILIQLTILFGGIKHLTTTIIEPTTNEILFKSMGILIPDLSWATVRTRINVSDLFKETNQLCKAVKVMDREYKRLGRKYANGKRKIKIPPTKV